MPILIFYGINNALGDLFYVYFYINLTAYARATPIIILTNLGISINLALINLAHSLIQSKYSFIVK